MRNRSRFCFCDDSCGSRFVSVLFSCLAEVLSSLDWLIMFSLEYLRPTSRR